MLMKSRPRGGRNELLPSKSSLKIFSLKVRNVVIVCQESPRIVSFNPFNNYLKMISSCNDITQLGSQSNP